MNFEKLALTSILAGVSTTEQYTLSDFTSYTARFIYKLILKYEDKYKKIPSKDVLISAIQNQISESKSILYIGYVKGLPKNVEDTQVIIEGLRDSKAVKALDSKIEELVEFAQNREIGSAKTILNELLVTLSDTETNAEDASDVIFDTERIHKTPFCLKDVALEAQGVTLISAPSGCVDAKTEFLTPNGWKYIKDYKEGDEVLQWDKDGSTKFVKPEAYINKPCAFMYHLKNKYVDMMYSPEHRVVYTQVSGGGNKFIYEKTMEEVYRQDKNDVNGFHGSFINSFLPPESEGLPFSDDELRLIVAIQADGHFPKQNSEGNFHCRINLKKENKKIRLEKLLNNCGIPYKKTVSSSKGFHVYTFQALKPWKSLKYLWKANKYQLEVIAEEVVLWDGSVGRNTEYYSTDKDSVDFVHYCFSCVYGTRASLSVDDRVGQTYKTGGKDYIRKSVSYSVRKTSFKASSIAHHADKPSAITKIVPEDGREYCFTVPSSYWVMRRNGYIVVTGNCGKSVLALQQALHSYKEGNDILFLNLELSKTEMLSRALSCSYDIPISDIYKNLSEEEVKKYSKLKDELFSLPNKFKMVNKNMQADEIISMIKAEAKTGLDVVVIDYLQLVDKPQGYGEQWQFLTVFVKQLHQLSLELGITIISPIQVNEVNFKNDNIHITTRGSRELEFSSSLWVHIHQDDSEAKDNMCRLFTIKARHAQKATYILETQFNKMKFKSTGLQL